MNNLKAMLLAVLERHTDAEKWPNSTFGKIRQLPNTKVGDVGQDYIEDLCTKFGFVAKFPEDKLGKRAKQSPWDVEINGVKFELKTASEDVSGSFQFNHIRYARSYNALICLGIAPDSILFNLWTKADVATEKAGKLVSMEKSGSASYKLTKRKNDLLSIDEFENRLSAFLAEFKH